MAIEFSSQVTLSVAIRTTPEVLFTYLTDIRNLTRFFPQVEFEVDGDAPLQVGSVYRTRQKGAKNWSRFRVLVLEPDREMSAMLVGADPLFAAMRYRHQFIAQGAQTVSHETVDYTFRFGVLGRLLDLVIGRRLVRKQVLGAHLLLKELAEGRA